MANSSTKKIAAANTSFLAMLLRAMAFVNTLTIAVLFLYFRYPTIGWVWLPYYLSMGASLALYRTIASMGAVTKGDGGRVTGVAADLGGPGLHQYVFDAFAVVMTAQIGSLVSSWGWYLLAIIPAYAVFRIGKLVKGFFF